MKVRCSNIDRVELCSGKPRTTTTPLPVRNAAFKPLVKVTLIGRVNPKGFPAPQACVLTFTRYCHCQYCMLYGIRRGGRGGGRILHNSQAIVFQSCGHCRWGSNKRMIDSHSQKLSVKQYVKAKPASLCDAGFATL